MYFETICLLPGAERFKPEQGELKTYTYSYPNLNLETHN